MPTRRGVNSARLVARIHHDAQPSHRTPYAERVDSTAVRRSSIYYLAHCLDALVPQMSLSMMSGIKSLMDETGGWQELSHLGATPLLHTGHGTTPEQSAMVELLMEHFPQWKSAATQPQ